MLQTLAMEVADKDKFDFKVKFDPLDDTKTWPKNIFPLQSVGRRVLNKNPDNFFVENEEVIMLVLRTSMSVCHCMCLEQSFVAQA